jgi:urease beta subunit
VINVSSHYHFYEVNPRLAFERPQAWGRHLDIQAGRSMIWKPGETHEVVLVPFAGAGIVDGFQGTAPPEGAAVRPTTTANPKAAPEAGRVR